MEPQIFDRRTNASSDVPDEDIRTTLGEEKNGRLLGCIAEAHRRDIGDVATKLAIVILEGNNSETGPIAEAVQSILGLALAELVMLADGLLPRADGFNALGEAELEMQAVPICAVDREMDGGQAD